MRRKRIRRPLGYPSGRLAQKAVVVTGGTSPLGLLMAQGLAQEGASVLVVCHLLTQQAVMVDPGSIQEGAPILWTSGDTRRKVYCQSVVDYAIQRFGRLDALINNADYEFEPVWPPQPWESAHAGEPAASVEASDTAIPVTGTAADAKQPFSEDVSENFNQAALGVMRPGSVLIHLQAPDRPIPLTLHPSLSYPRDAEQLLRQRGVRVEYLLPGSLWVASLFDQFPQAIPDEKAVEILSLIDFCISLISKE